MRKKFLPIAICLFFLLGIPLAFAQSVTPSPTTAPDTSQAKQDIQNRINELQNKINDLHGKEKSLSSEIAVMDNQINLTELRIDSTKSDINETRDDIAITNNKIDKLESSLDDLTKVLMNRIVANYKIDSGQSMQMITGSSKNLENYVTKQNYLKFIQDHDKQMLLAVQQSKNDYSNQKQLFVNKQQKLEALKSRLEDYTKELDAQQEQKKTLLSETQGSEANYQRLLSQAKAQLAGFSRFTASQGGASLLSGQTVCDDWGCYYSQRDTQWGGQPLNGTQYTLASDGCLVTSMAMVYTHLGYKNVTPATINSNASNFASYYPAYLLFTITADGVTLSRVNITRSQMDDELAAGHAVVVGISYDSGPIADHFIVIMSGSNGDYIMQDPYTANGNRMPLTDKYSVASIREMYKIVQ